MFNVKDLLSQIEERFADFEATYRELADDLAVLDWRNKSGSGIDSVRLIFSANQVFVGGDLGDGIFNLTEKASLSRFAHYSPEYVVQKIACGDQYRFDQDAAFASLDESIAQLTAFVDENSDLDEEEKGVQKYELAMIADGLKEGFTSQSGFLGHGCAQAVEDYLCYDSDGIESLEYAGRHIAPRVYMWLKAASMAYSQIS